MITLASTTIRGAVATIDAPDRVLTNPTADDVTTQVMALVPGGTVTVSTTEDDAFQVLSDGNVVFKTDLPATTTKQINILDVLTNQYPVTNPVEVVEDTDTFTISNEYHTVTVRKTQNLGTPLTPIASIVPATGTVQLTGSTFLDEWAPAFSPVTSGSPSYRNYDPQLTGYTFEVIEQGPLLVRVKATYSFSHILLSGGGITIFPANSNAEYSETIEVRAGVNAVFIEHASDYAWISGYDIDNLDVDQLRYRGYRASSSANGYMVISGTPSTYLATTNQNKTAIKDLTGALGFGDYVNNPFIPLWDRNISNTGRYVIARDSTPGTQYVAAIAGGASRGIGTATGGVKFTEWGTGTRLMFGYTGRTTGNVVYTPCRYPWAVMIGDEPVPADESETVPEPGVIYNQSILFTLEKLLNWVPQSASETFYSTGLYLPAAQQDAILDRIRTDSAYAAELIAKDSTATALIQYVQAPTLAKAEAIYDPIIANYENALDLYWHKNGYFDLYYSYWQAALAFVRDQVPDIPFLLDGTDLSAEQRTNLYRAMLFFGLLMADEDFVPLYAEAVNGYPMGSANNPIQYTQNMDSLHLMLLSNPVINEYFDLPGFVQRQIYRINSYISEYGSSLGSPHYTQTGTEPTLNMCQQALLAGLADLTLESPRFALFAEFMMQTLTPADSRFGNRRKLIALGDGSLEGSPLHGQLGTIFASSNPTLSARLMDAWASMDQPHSGFYGYTFLKIVDTLPTQSMALGDAHYPDYMSIFRSGFDTADESTVWFLHGDWYADHRNYDTGGTYFYLLGKPIALSWSSVYTPQISGSILLNGLTVSPGTTWDGTGGLVPCDNAGGADYDIRWGSSRFNLNAITYTPSSTRPTTQATFDLDASTTWTRTVMLNKADVTRPVVVIEDEFVGTTAANEKILSLNLMMTGAVVTPGGNVTPSTTANRATSTNKTALSSGWSTFEFTGQWGVNLILMVYSAASANYQLGRFSHTSSPAIEKSQYLTATGSSYSEMQYQFRLWSTDDSKFVLVPWLASGAKPVVTTDGLDILVDGDVVT